MSLESATEQIRQKMSYASQIDAKIKFNFGGDGLIFIDATQNPPLVSHEDEEADCTLSLSLETFEGLLDGTQDPNIAFMMGKLKVEGSVGIAMKLNSILED